MGIAHILQDSYCPEADFLIYLLPGLLRKECQTGLLVDYLKKSSMVRSWLMLELANLNLIWWL